jgi:hypothetical protein
MGELQVFCMVCKTWVDEKDVEAHADMCFGKKGDV